MDIKSFRALRFNREIVGDPGTCIAPPYDVIDEVMQQELHDSNPYNIIRADKGIKYPDDNVQNNVYTRAADFLNKAIRERALLYDPQESLYGYVQDFRIADNAYERSGIIALGRLKPFGQWIRPHEKTLEGPKADRLNLTRATATQLGQIFMLYDDPEKTAEQILRKAMKNDPALDFTDKERVRHRLYIIRQPDQIHAFADMIAPKQGIIADGHHRYETALNYWAETGNPKAEWQMMAFVNMYNEGLIIQPTHRLVAGLPDFSVRHLLDRVSADFAVQKFPFANETEKADAQALMFDQMKQSRSEDKPIFGLYAADRAFYVLTLSRPEAMAKQAPQMSQASRRLDVNVLHLLILEKHLQIGDAKLARQSHIEYIKDLGDAIDKSVALVDSGKAQAVFFVNPTRMSQVRAVAEAGEKMPQKSTFFYPKIFSGLTVHTMQAEPKETHNFKPVKQECTQ
jgi:uncharacterized protein (DUF1015 family)